MKRPLTAEERWAIEEQAKRDQAGADFCRKPMVSDYARELGECLDRLAELVPKKGPGSRRLARLSPEDKKYVGDKARAAEDVLTALRMVDFSDRLSERLDSRFPEAGGR